MLVTTLRALMETMNGLYRGPRGSFLHAEVVERTPDSLLDRRVALSRIDTFVYGVSFPDGESEPFTVYSRRRQDRSQDL